MKCWPIVRIPITFLHFDEGSGGPKKAGLRPRTALALVLLVFGLPVRAQDTGQGGAGDDLPEPPAIGRPHLDDPSRPRPEDPPPLNLGGPDSSTGAGAQKPGANRWGAYAHAVQSALETAVRANTRTRNKAFDVQCEMWIDPKGHVTRVQLVKPTGDADLDAALRNEILPRLALPEPASDMPMPVKGHIAARAQ